MLRSELLAVLFRGDDLERFVIPKHGKDDAADLMHDSAHCCRSFLAGALPGVVVVNYRIHRCAAPFINLYAVSYTHLDIRSLFKHALLNNAEFVICVHNHPSGDPGPSREDEEITGRIRSAGALLGIELVDHIILGEGDAYYSFRDHGWLCGDGRFPAA